jgi:hypothetical protein
VKYLVKRKRRKINGCRKWHSYCDYLKNKRVRSAITDLFLQNQLNKHKGHQKILTHTVRYAGNDYR